MTLSAFASLPTTTTSFSSSAVYKDHCLVLFCQKKVSFFIHFPLHSTTNHAVLSNLFPVHFAVSNFDGCAHMYTGQYQSKRSSQRQKITRRFPCSTQLGTHSLSRGYIHRWCLKYLVVKKSHMRDQSAVPFDAHHVSLKGVLIQKSFG